MGLGKASSGTNQNFQGMPVVDAGNSAQDVDAGAMTTDVKSQQRRKMKPRGAASKLFDKFSSDRQYDPFLDSDQVIQDSKAGMETLLSMCNPVEINSLYGALGFIEPCTRRAKEHQIMEVIRKGGREVQKTFSEVLRLFWEGLLYEYLRSVGCPLRGSEHDPRHFVLRYWQRSTLDPSVQQGFVPFYLKREVKQRSGIIEEDRDIRDIRAGLMACEKAVKETEQRVREQHDYRFVLQYFCASRELHRTLVANVNYLANEVEQLRASVDHSDESIKLMEQQLLELETKYDRVVGGLVHRSAFQQTLEGTLYGMINDANATLRAAEIAADEVLATMKVGPGDNNDGDLTLDSVNGDSSSPPLANDSRVEISVAEQVDEPARLAAPRPKHSTTPYHQSRDSREQCIAPVRSAAQPGGCWIRRDGPLGCRLERMRETHREACRRYDSVLTNLETNNITLADELSEASTARDSFATKATGWEVRHDALENRLAKVERASKADIAKAIEHANEERERARKATDVLRGMLERSTPILLDMVSTFALKDSEKFGVELLRALDVNPDIYTHIVATKRMFQADLESRALETATAERDRTTADMENIEEEVKEDIKNKQERPGSRGKKESRSARKGKGDSESKSRPKPSEGDMVATTKEGRADGSGKARSTGRETSGSGQGGEKYPPIKAQGKKHDGTTGKGASESVRVIRQGLLRKGNQGKKNL